MDKEELTKELQISKEKGSLTDKSILFISEIVDKELNKFLSRYNLNEKINTKNQKLIKQYDTEACFEHALVFKSERLKIAHVYITQITQCALYFNIKKILTKNNNF